MIDRIRAAWYGWSHPSIESFIVSQGNAIQHLQGLLEDARKPRKDVLDPRGVIVMRDGGGGTIGIEDEFADADSWTIDRSEGDAWLHLFDLSMRQVTTYKPGQWLHVESGRLADITIKTEGDKPTT